MGKIDNAVNWMVGIANDSSHGYDQTNRWGPDYDCSSLVIQAWENAGVPVKTNGATYTGNMYSVFTACGFVDVTDSITLSTGAGIQRGDVLLHHANHTALVVNSSEIVQASINEYGTTTGGSIGDQTGREIYVRSYYNYPWQCVLRYTGDDSGGDSGGDIAYYFSGNYYLTLEQMKVNAQFVYQYLYPRGWSLNAIAAMLGNMQTESTINPGIWESLSSYSGGYGLVQWTPYTKYTNWCDARGYEWGAMESALARIEWELANGEQYYATDSYPLSFSSFKTSTLDVGYLAMAFLYNYERPASLNQPNRATQAEFWFDYLGGISIDPDNPINPPTYVPKHNLSLLLLIAASRRF